QFVERLLVDLAEPVAAGLVERCGTHLVEQLFDHGPDAHDLRGFLDIVRHGILLLRRLVLSGVGRGATWGTVRTDDRDTLRLAAFRGAACSVPRFAHGPTIASPPAVCCSQRICYTPAMTVN